MAGTLLWNPREPILYLKMLREILNFFITSGINSSIPGAK